MGLVTSLLATALLGHATVEGNWVIFFLDTSAYHSPEEIEAMAAEVVDDLRSTVPAPGFGRVEIPGQREHRLMLHRRRTGTPIHPAVWKDLEDLHARVHATGAGDVVLVRASDVDAPDRFTGSVDGEDRHDIEFGHELVHARVEQGPVVGALHRGRVVVIAARGEQEKGQEAVETFLGFLWLTGCRLVRLALEVGRRRRGVVRLGGC